MDNLKYGSRGTDVELLQLALTRSGYYNSPYGIDGIFGADTQNAVRRFQAAFGLAADGIVGRDTKKALLPFLIGGFTTKIRSGDTFYRLAKHYGTTIGRNCGGESCIESGEIGSGNGNLYPVRL